MLNIPESIKTLFKTDGVFKNFRVHFPNGEHADLTNSDIVSESVQFTESICSKEVFQFGLSERPSVEFECVNVPNIYGVTIECGIEIDTSSLTAQEIADIQSGTYDGSLVLESDSDIGFGYYHIPYGTFIIENCPRSQGAMWKRRVTAYSKESKNAFNRFINTLKFPNNVFCMGVDGVKALYDDSMRTELTTHTNTITGSDFTMNHLFDSSGNDYSLKITGVHRKTANGRDGTASFVRATFTEEEGEKCNAFGARVASCIGSLGYDLSFNSTGGQQFASNVAMLQLRAGELFAPTINGNLDEITSSGTYAQTDVSNDFILNNDEITPYVTSNGAFPDARSVAGGDLRFRSGSVVYVYQVDSNPTVSILRNNVEVASMPIGSDYADFTINPTITFFSVSSVGQILQLQSTSEIKNGIFAGGTNRYFNSYSFNNAVTVENLIESICEINGEFLAYNRSGGYTFKQISDNYAHVLRKSDYMDVWYDDYTVSPVGFINVEYGDNLYCEIELRNGGTSVYEISNNAVIDNLGITDEASAVSAIQLLLYTTFVQPLSKIHFLPTNAEIIGLPFLEAGDRIYISGETGVNTLVLTRTLSGIQTLTDSIESKGGEVLGDGS